MSSRATRLKSDKFSANISKRGNVVVNVDKRDAGPAVSPLLLGFFFFVLVGSTVFQIIRNAQGGPIF